MKTVWRLGIPALLAVSTVLTGCYDDRPGRHRPPHGDQGRPGNGRPDNGRPDNGRPGRPDDGRPGGHNGGGDHNRPGQGGGFPPR